MTDPNLYLLTALATLAGLAIVTAGALAGWRGWLALKHKELAMQQAGFAAPSGGHNDNGHIGARIELADLKERIRKLEAIAAGVDL